MKVRNGFVSNSSSSSFVVFTTEESHEQAMNKLNPWQQGVVGSLMEKKQFCGKTVYVGGVYRDASGGGTFEYNDYVTPPEGSFENEDDYGSAPWQAWETYLDYLLKDQTIHTDVGDGG